GIREPKPEAAEVEPDILIVPLLAFDRSGHRIGYGAGYYDLTIAALRAKKPIVAVGIAYAVQEIPALPITPRDARLDLVLTARACWWSTSWDASSWIRSTIRSRRSSASCPPARSSARPTPSSSTSIAKPPARSRRWVTSAMAAPASWSAPTRTHRRPIIRFC